MGNPFQDIMSIEVGSIKVLKDAAAPSIYGSRGGNGAILISTKNGNSGRLRLIEHI
jgi:TonB-dependent SusC/RagA subfamily outer membrane receptor